MGWAAMLAALSTALAVASWRGSPLARLGRRPFPGEWVAAQRSPPRQRVLGTAAVAASALLLVAVIGWWSIPVAVVLGVGSYLMLGRLATGEATRRGEELSAGLPQACDLLAVCLESGLPLRVAVEVVAELLDGPRRQALAELSAKVRLGSDEAQAWTELAATEPALAQVGREVVRTVGSGISLSRTLRALGVETRREALAAAEVRAKRVGVHSVLPLMVCFLPAFLLLGVVPIIGGVVQHLFR